MKTNSKRLKRLFAVLMIISLMLSYTTVAMATTVEDMNSEEVTGLAEAQEQEQERSETLEEEEDEDTALEKTSEVKEVPEPSENETAEGMIPEETTEHEEETEPSENETAEGTIPEETTEYEEEPEPSENENVESTIPEETTEYEEEPEPSENETVEGTIPEETTEYEEEPEHLEEVMETSSAASDAKDSDVAVYNAIRGWQSTTKSVEPPSTYDEVYNRIVACMEIIPQGTVWTDFMPYGTYTSLSPHDKDDPNIGYLGEAYTWNGGVFKVNPSDPGSRSGTGCAAFAFMMSDAAFGGMSARVVQKGNIQLENVHPGDILRDVNNTHFVIVLQTTEDGAVIAEANVKIDMSDTTRIGKVNWSRTISKAEVENSSFMLTRYVEGQDYNGDIQETLVKEGDMGKVHWTLNNKGVLTFSGTGPIIDFATWKEDNNGIWIDEIFERPWETGVTTRVTSIKIGSGITSIGAYAFYQSPAMSVTIPNSVTSIGIRAFYGSSLISVSIPKGTIGYEAFRKCQDIKTLELGEGVTSIGNNAFGGCSGIATDLVTPFTIPASVETIGGGAFMSCGSIYRLEFAPNSKLTSIGGGAFAQCWGLLAIELPYGLTRLEANLFQNSLSLWKLYIPGSVTAIDRETLMDTRAMQEIYYGGTEEQWIAANGPDALKYTTANVTVSYNICSIFNPTYGGATHVYDNDADAICNNCGYVRTPGATSPDTPPSDTHTHNWSTDWSHDSSYHWHDCTIPNCDVSENTLKSGYGSHMFGDWITDTEATTNTAGTKHRICTICEYSETSTIPIVPDNPSSPSNPDTPPSDTHTHNWSMNWSNDSSYHWHDCTIPNCDVSENTLKSGYGSHMFGDWITDTEATTSTLGTKHRICMVCEYSETSTIPIVPDNPSSPSNPDTPPSDTHTHNWSMDWSHDSSYHWHDCIIPNCDVSENTLKSGYGSHMFGDWIPDTEATTSTVGTKHRICMVCEYSETSTIPIVPNNPNPPSNPSTPSTPSNPSTPSIPSNSSTSNATISTKKNSDGSVTTIQKDNKTGNCDRNYKL